MKEARQPVASKHAQVEENEGVQTGVQKVHGLKVLVKFFIMTRR